MRATPSASLSWIPPEADRESLVTAARGCQACPLYAHATQTVFGEGPAPAALMFVGEQPGDREDRDGHPFVGPAGRVLDRLLETAKIPRERVYLTNAVKHFKWEPRGKRRLHSRPNATEADACRGWLEAEIAIVRPKVIVCLGAVAVQVFFGRAVSVVKDRGKLLPGAPWAKHVVVTYHPSALLRRLGAGGDSDELRDALLADLVLAAKAADRAPTSRARRTKARAL